MEQVLDSSRFFAVRVQGDGGRKAVLGIGFEERGVAFDFCVALQECRKTLGIEKDDPKKGGKKGKEVEAKEEKRDFSLKEGETITVNIGGKGMGRRKESGQEKGLGEGNGGFSLPPPPPYPGGGLGSLLPPPPSAQEVKAQKRRSLGALTPQKGSIEDMGFDDGEFGEFQ